uniref:Transposase n=1 Tax=Kalanchoe fedtschenkoi TaxID=63787 RepID=A0A7N0VHX1_KALFE
MVITCQFVCEWKLHKRVLSFCHIPPPHNGVVVCEVLNHSLNEWNLTSKLATVTDDNATYNDVAIIKLKDILSYQRKVPLDGVFFHVRCCDHIINLFVHDGLNDIEDIIHNEEKQ